MEQRNEPTTGEIVRDLQRILKVYNSELGGIDEYDIEAAIDRLESQERKITEIENFHKEMLKDHNAQVAELAARAESAERERDAAVKDMWLMRSCQSCKHKPEGYTHIRCACPDCDDEDKWEWRGLQPQDGGAE